MIEYGYTLDKGTGVTKNHVLACDWYEKAANLKNARGMNNLGACFANGDGRPADLEKGRSWYEQSAALGDGLALKNLGDLHYNGGSVARDLVKAAGYYRRSAEAGDASGMVSYALTLLSGHGTAKNEKDACKWFEKAAEASKPHAINAVGACYENGFGRKRDLKAALSSYQRAAELGSGMAMRNLARANDTGTGTARDPQKAAAWLRKALQSGAPAVLNDLISSPHDWNRATLRELQRLLKKEGIYDGPADGVPSAEFDDALWTRAAVSTADGDARLKQEFVRVPLSGAPRGLLVRICRSDSVKPQPLIVINHGLTTDKSRRRLMRPEACGPVAEFFTSLGYVVAYPLRRGYGETGGTFVEGGARVCSANTEFASAGGAIADDIEAVIKHLTARNDIVRDKTVVVGHSGGGWGTVALASRNPRGIATYINFSGGHGSRRGKPNGNCGPEPLVRAASKFGKNARQRMLWIYVENDTVIGPALAKRMHQSFTRAGGNARLELLPPYENEGHNLFTDDGIGIWGPVIEKWLTSSSAL